MRGDLQDGIGPPAGARAASAGPLRAVGWVLAIREHAAPAVAGLLSADCSTYSPCVSRSGLTTDAGLHSDPFEGTIKHGLSDDHRSIQEFRYARLLERASRAPLSTRCATPLRPWVAITVCGGTDFAYNLTDFFSWIAARHPRGSTCQLLFTYSTSARAARSTSPHTNRTFSRVYRIATEDNQRAGLHHIR